MKIYFRMLGENSSWFNYQKYTEEYRKLIFDKNNSIQKSTKDKQIKL